MHIYDRFISPAKVAKTDKARREEQPINRWKRICRNTPLSKRENHINLGNS